MKRTYVATVSPLFAASALTIVLLAQLGLAIAQTAPPSPHKPDGGRHEHMRARWVQADLDKDGQLSKAEAQAAGMKHLTDNFDAIDANKDGKVSEAEVGAWLKAKHGARGAHAAKGTSPPTGQAGTAPFGKAPPPVAGAAGNPPTAQAHGGGMDYKTPEQRQAAMKERFAKADTNKDGGLSKAEAQAAGMHRLVENFDAIDTNKDGKVTPEEMRAAWERRKP